MVTADLPSTTRDNPSTVEPPSVVQKAFNEVFDDMKAASLKMSGKIDSELQGQSRIGSPVEAGATPKQQAEVPSSANPALPAAPAESTALQPSQPVGGSSATDITPAAAVPPQAGVPKATDGGPTLPDANFAATAQAVLAKLGIAGNAVITPDQLESALQDPSIQGQDAQALAALYLSYSYLSPESGGTFLVAGDLAKFNANWQNYALESLDMGDNSQSMFSKYGDNGNTITLDQLKSSLNDPSMTNATAQGTMALIANFSKVSNGSSVVTQADIDAYAKQLDANDPTALSGAEAFVEVSRAIGYVQAAETPSIAGKHYGDSGPINPGGVVQGDIGDCYFDADLAAVAAANPKLIQNAIQDNGNGTYTVTFPGAPSEPITVSAPTPAELGVFNQATQGGTWAAVMEAAYGQYRKDHSWTQGALNYFFGSSPPEEGADGGGQLGPAMNLLTGSNSHTDVLLFQSESTVASELTAALNPAAPKAVSAGIANWPWAATSAGFPTGHAYTIDGFDPKGPGGGTVTVRNPWGPSSPPVDGKANQGTVQISLSEFLENFTELTIAG